MAKWVTNKPSYQFNVLCNALQLDLTTLHTVFYQLWVFLSLDIRITKAVIRLSRILHREYFMESAGVRYLRTSCWRIRNRTSERSERVRFLIQKQRVGKYRTKHFPCGILFIINILRHSSFLLPFYFKYFKNAEICRYTLTAKWQRKRSISFLVKTFVKNINDGEDMR